MNNIKIIQEKTLQAEPGNDRLKRETSLARGVQVLDAIQALKQNNDYATFKRFVLDPSIEIVQKRIERNVKDLVHNENLKNEIFQDQGMLIAFKKFADLDELELLYKQQTESLANQIQRDEHKSKK